MVLSNEVLPCGAFGNSRVFELLDRFRNGGFIYEIAISELLQNSRAELIRINFRLSAPISRSSQPFQGKAKKNPLSCITRILRLQDSLLTLPDQERGHHLNCTLVEIHRTYIPFPCLFFSYLFYSKPPGAGVLSVSLRLDRRLTSAPWRALHICTEEEFLLAHMMIINWNSSVFADSVD